MNDIDKKSLVNKNVYTAQIRISSVNVTKFAVFWGFGYIYWRNPWWETSLFVQC